MSTPFCLHWLTVPHVDSLCLHWLTVPHVDSLWLMSIHRVLHWLAVPHPGSFWLTVSCVGLLCLTLCAPGLAHRVLQVLLGLSGRVFSCCVLASWERCSLVCTLYSHALTSLYSHALTSLYSHALTSLLTHSHSSSLVVMMKSKELKTKISHTHSLIRSHLTLPVHLCCADVWHNFDF